MKAKHPKNKLSKNGFKVKTENEKGSHLYARVVFKIFNFGNFTPLCIVP